MPRAYRVLEVTLAAMIALLMVLPVGSMLGFTNNARAGPSETVLRIGFLEVPDSLNPQIGLNDASWFFYGLVYDSLTTVGNDLETVHDLATSWWVVPESDPELIVSGEPHGSVWQYNLTHNATWSDGVPFTADDVVWNINLNAGNYSMMWGFQPYSYWMNYAEKVDNYTVRVHFYDRATLEPVPCAYGYLLSIPMLPKHKLENYSVAEISFTWPGAFLGEPMPVVGTGPFMATPALYDDWVAGENITLARNPNCHWESEYGRLIHFDKLVMDFYADAAQMEDALRNGLIDAAKFPRENYLSIKNDVALGILENVTTFDGPALNQYWTDVGFCMTTGGSNPSRLDPVIREALARATNKEYIAQSVYNGLAQAGSTLVAPVNSYWHYEPNTTEKYEYDLSAASAMLDAGGYTDIDVDGIRECTASSYAVQTGLVSEGTKLDYDMMVRQDHPEEITIAGFLQYEWASIGVNLTPILVDEATMSSIVYSYNYDTALWYWSQDLDPNYILFTQSSRAIAAWSDNAYSSPSFDDNYNMSVQEMNISERKVHTDACQQIAYQDAAYLVLAYLDQTYAWRTDTFTGWGDWSADPGRSLDNIWSANPLFFDLAPIVAENSPPEGLSLDGYPTDALVDQKVTFVASAIDVDGDNLSFYVEYGDGASDAAQTIGGSPAPQGVMFVHAYGFVGDFVATVWVDDGNGSVGHNITKSTEVHVFLTPPRTIEYRWYDMFNVPFGEWWYTRYGIYAYEEPVTDSYPYILERYGPPTGRTDYYSSMRLDVTAKNVSEIRMSANPWFLPVLGPETGGNASIYWDMFYPTDDELNATHPALYAWSDGWIVELKGNISLDRQAAMAVLNLTSSDFDNFAAWWAANSTATSTAFADWFNTQGNSAFDIYNAYEYPFMTLAFDLNATKDGDRVILSLDHFSWGMEILMTRWLRNAFMGTEWYFEDFHMGAEIGPDVTSLDISTVVAYAVMASETIRYPPGDPSVQPCWTWMGMLQDYVSSSLVHPHSDFDRYENESYLERSPGSLWYGMMVPYDYTPGAFNLSEGESMTFEWPSGTQLFKAHDSPGATVDMLSAMTVDYSEPTDSDFPGQVVTDTGLRTLTLEGPIDVWTWSKEETNLEHQFLQEEWARLSLLPYGMPYIEFVPEARANLSLDHFVVDLIRAMSIDEYSDVRVTAYDKSGLVFTDYAGTVTFSTNASDGTYILPADYTYTSADLGQRVFPNSVSFTQAGIYNVSASDVVLPSARGTQGDIVITMPLPEEIFTLYGMFQQPFDDSWIQRSRGYFQDYILSNETGKYAWFYDPGQDYARGIIYAPYRWNTTAKNMSTLSVETPEFLPAFGTKNVPGAQADMSIYFTYLNYSWWNNYWVPTWSSDPYWYSSGMSLTWNQQIDDGYAIGVVYNIMMNRQAAETLLGMPQTGVAPADWWAANSATYASDWATWIDNEGNWRLDIYCGYADKYYNLGYGFKLAELPDGNISFTIGHTSWGYEVLMTRWLTESTVCTHEPYWEDFTLSAKYKNGIADVTFDGVGRYNFHAVKANESTANDAAWVWEPTKIDYIVSSGRHVSEYDPWAYLYYWSWNAGDPYFNDYTFYDATPNYFNLTSYQSLVINLPTGNDVLGYKAEKAPSDAIWLMGVMDDYTFYDNLKFFGTCDLGFWITNPAGGGADLDSMYDPFAKTLTINGPQNFDQFHWPDGQIYHGTPWIEFNVTPLAGPTDPPVADAGSDQLVLGGVPVMFDGSMSTSYYGIENYTWTFMYDGQPVALYDVKPIFTFWIEGVYEVTLNITDSMGRNATDTVTITVSGIIPEFDGLWVPVLVALVAVAIVGISRRRRG